MRNSIQSLPHTCNTPRLFTIHLPPKRTLRFHNAGYIDEPGGHLHVERSFHIKHEIFIIEHGVLHIEIDGTPIAADAGTVLFTPRGTRQRGYAPSPGRIRYVWLHFDATVEELDSESDATDTAISMVRDSIGAAKHLGAVCIPLVSRPGHITSILDIGHMIARHHPCAETEKSALTTALLCQITRMHLQETSGAISGPGARRIADIGTYIHSLAINDNLVRSLTPQHVAAHFRMNPIYLNRLFKKHTGTTIGHRIVTERIKQARYLLSIGRSVKEAALACGFTTSKYFARQFRAELGSAPSKYREETKF